MLWLRALRRRLEAPWCCSSTLGVSRLWEKLLSCAHDIFHKHYIYHFNKTLLVSVSIIAIADAVNYRPIEHLHQDFLELCKLHLLNLFLQLYFKLFQRKSKIPTNSIESSLKTKKTDVIHLSPVLIKFHRAQYSLRLALGQKAACTLTLFNLIGLCSTPFRQIPFTSHTLSDFLLNLIKENNEVDAGGESEWQHCLHGRQQ